MKKIIKYIFYACIPLFICYALYSQMQCMKIVEMYNTLKYNDGVSSIEEASNISLGITFIPGSSSYIELLSTTKIFNAMYVISQNNEVGISSKIFNGMSESYTEYLKNNDVSLFLYNYNAVNVNMLYYFNDYTTFGSDSTVTLQSKRILDSSVKSLSIVAVFKMIIFILLAISAMVGLLVYRAYRIDQANDLKNYR